MPEEQWILNQVQDDATLFPIPSKKLNPNRQNLSIIFPILTLSKTGETDEPDRKDKERISG